eukprot:2279833-Amphidinium_carterae.2
MLDVLVSGSVQFQLDLIEHLVKELNEHTEVFILQARFCMLHMCIVSWMVLQSNGAVRCQKLAAINRVEAYHLEHTRVAPFRAAQQ